MPLRLDSNSRIGQLMRLAIAIRSGFWFMPSLMVLGSVGLALVTGEIDRQFGSPMREQWPRLFDTRSESAKLMLSTTASSMITVAGVVFSITLVALTLASSQYSSRVLRNFMRDRANQVVLGTFLGVYAYCLTVLRSVSGETDGFVPALGVLVALLLAGLSIGALIFFIHHIVVAIQAGQITRNIAEETLQTICQMFPDQAAATDAPPGAPVGADTAGWHAVPSRSMGYIQSVDPEALFQFARQHDTTLRMARGVGEFIAEGRPLALIALAQAPDEHITLAVNRLYAIDSFRTTDRDPAFGLRQLVDIALKALSPAVNDTTTAITCLDYLTVIVQRLAVCRLDPDGRYRQSDKVGVITCAPGFEDFVALAFDQITDNAEGNAAVLTRLLAAVGELLQVTCVADRREILMRRLEMLGETVERTTRSPYQLQALRRALENARATPARASATGVLGS